MTFTVQLHKGIIVSLGFIQWRQNMGNERNIGIQRDMPPLASQFWAVKKLSKNFLLVGKFLSKIAKFEAEIHNFGEI